MLRKTMIVLASALALGSATLSTNAFARGGGGGGIPFTGGGSYTMGAISVGLEGLYDRFQLLGDTAHVNIWGVSLNAAYALGPGISLEGQVAYTESDNNAGGTFFDGLSGENSMEIDFGTAINF